MNDPLELHDPNNLMSLDADFLDAQPCATLEDRQRSATIRMGTIEATPRPHFTPTKFDAAIEATARRLANIYVAENSIFARFLDAFRPECKR